MPVPIYVPTMASDNRCGYTWPADHDIGDSPNRQHCCFRETLDGTDRCVWHADVTDGKTIEALQEARVDPAVRRQTSPVSERQHELCQTARG